MLTIVISLTVLCTLLVVALVWAIVVVVRYGKMLLDIEQTTEKALDTIDSRYRIICSISERSLVSHDPFVRQLVSNIEGLKNDILSIARGLVSAGTRTQTRENM